MERQKKRSLGRTARRRVRVEDRKVSYFYMALVLRWGTAVGRGESQLLLKMELAKGVAAARAACLRSRRRGDVNRLTSHPVARARLLTARTKRLTNSTALVRRACPPPHTAQPLVSLLPFFLCGRGGCLCLG